MIAGVANLERKSLVLLPLSTENEQAEREKHAVLPYTRIPVSIGKLTLRKNAKLDELT